MLPHYVLLDLETTGAMPLKDRITEIALIRFEHGIEVARWQTLVNPCATISPFIQELTGISNQMVSNAPTFDQVANQLLGFLNGAVLCAHNVKFDHGFLKNEFKRIEINLRQKVLCTVKLSRKLYPEHRSHSLDSIMQRHGLTCAARHRAMGDVELMVGLIDTVKRELGIERLRTVAELLSKESTLPAGLDQHLVEDLPESPGVYLFFGENNLPLYIGKNANIRTRVMAFFSSDHATVKETRIVQEIKNIEWIETAGEFGALLLESRLIKERKPIHNKQLLRERKLCAWQLATTADAQPLLTLVRDEEIKPEYLGELFGTYRTKIQAVEALRNIVDKYALCAKFVGLETGYGPCFAHQLKRCKGVCADKESKKMHYLRLQQAMAAQRLASWPYTGRIAIKEHNHATDKTDLHVFEHWCYLGTVSDKSSLDEILNKKTALTFDLDTYKLLLKQLNTKQVEVIQLEACRT